MKHTGKRCPFLREAQMKSCQASSIRKLIPRSSHQTPEERCSSSEYLHCPVMHEFHEDQPPGDRCPFLHESLVQYCSASPVPKYTPYTESMLTRCGTENHKYCEQYLTYANPMGGSHDPGDDKGNNVDGVPFEPSFRYAANHMWLDTNDDGYCHVGFDAFLASLLGTVGSISFVQDQWDGKPAVLVSTHDVQLPLVFPQRLGPLTTNGSIRLHPEWLTSKPYSHGWLFEAKVPCDDHTATSRSCQNLLEGERARSWFSRDIHRLSERLHTSGLRSDTVFATDGGTLCLDTSTRLGREEVILLFNEFFSPFRTPEV